jgi:transcriptional regulator with XRE-family HTH domain
MAPLERDAWLRQIEDDILTDWGRRVRAARGPLSQERLAAIVGYDQRTISKIENGKTNPSIRLKWLIAGALGRTIDELFPNPSIRPPFPGGGTEGRI